VDYRKLNDVTKKDGFSLLRIDDTLDTLAGAKWFSTLDLKSDYWQVDVQPEDMEKTTFSTGQVLCQFTIMLFGFCNAPATFERRMETVLRGLPYDSCHVYLEDVIVTGRTFQVHLLNLRKLFREGHLKLNPRKCKYLQKEVRYLGHTVSSERIITDFEKLKAALELSTPKNKHEIRSFLGLCTSYIRFISGFSDISKPLTRLIEQKQSFQWTPQAEAAFQALKGTLCTGPILAYPKPGERFIVDTDVLPSTGRTRIGCTCMGVCRMAVAYFRRSSRATKKTQLT
jgi:hypothetical protein